MRIRTTWQFYYEAAFRCSGQMRLIAVLTEPKEVADAPPLDVVTPMTAEQIRRLRGGDDT